MENLLVWFAVLTGISAYLFATVRQQRKILKEKDEVIANLSLDRNKWLDKCLIRQGSTPLYEKAVADNKPPEPVLPTIAAKKAQWAREANGNGIPDYIQDAINSAKGDL